MQTTPMGSNATSQVKAARLSTPTVNHASSNTRNTVKEIDNRAIIIAAAATTNRDHKGSASATQALLPLQIPVSAKKPPLPTLLPFELALNSAQFQSLLAAGQATAALAFAKSVPKETIDCSRPFGMSLTHFRV